MSKKLSKKPKIVTVNICREEFEVDLNNLDPQWRTHCMLCGEHLTPAWQRDQGKCRRVADGVIGAACYECAATYVKSARRIRDELREEKRAQRKKVGGGKIRITRKRRNQIDQRSEQLNKRPCGCATKGRHRRECSLGGKND